MPLTTVQHRESEAPEARAAPATLLRVSDRLSLVYFTYAAAASFVFPLGWRERLPILGLNAVACAVVLLLARLSRSGAARTAAGSFAGRLDPAPARQASALGATISDWLPALLILLAYRESGLFITPGPAHHLDHQFVRWDALLLSNAQVLQALATLSPWLQYYLEFAYLLCYPLVPLGLGVLLLSHRRKDGGWALRPSDPKTRMPDPESRVVDRFWTTVLLALYFTYFAFPFFPLTPPRLLFHDLPGPVSAGFLRQINFWILAHYGVPACVFPSGHVAGVTAAALAVRRDLPRAGLAFLAAAVSIAVATVYLRYHYAADAIAGLLVAAAALLISNRLHRT